MEGWTVVNFKERLFLSLKPRLASPFVLPKGGKSASLYRLATKPSYPFNWQPAKVTFSKVKEAANKV
ncbi:MULTISPECIES: hypothetical protein [Sphingobacterium]|uniref:hypothetical protein n=1 Tax=Sphingobacterium TaxID=28453 RepID=UPI0013D9BEAF|nr:MULTISPECIES: hypothetical protein [unclassified Sphingobacterium]